MLACLLIADEGSIGLQVTESKEGICKGIICKMKRKRKLRCLREAMLVCLLIADEGLMGFPVTESKEGICKGIICQEKRKRKLRRLRSNARLLADC